MSEDKGSFWTSLQGILTGVASVIAAVTGLVVALHGGDPTADTGNGAADTTVALPAPAKTQSPASSPHTLSASGSAPSGTSGTVSAAVNSPPAPTTRVTPASAAQSEAAARQLQTARQNSLASLSVSKPQPVTVAKPLSQMVDCNSDRMLNNSVPSLMSWSNHYFREAQAHQGDGRLRADCEKLLQYRASAWCKDHSPGIRGALLESLKLCRVNDTLANWYQNR